MSPRDSELMAQLGETHSPSDSTETLLQQQEKQQQHKSLVSKRPRARRWSLCTPASSQTTLHRHPHGGHRGHVPPPISYPQRALAFYLSGLFHLTNASSPDCKVGWVMEVKPPRNNDRTLHRSILRQRCSLSLPTGMSVRWDDPEGHAMVTIGFPTGRASLGV